MIFKYTINNKYLTMEVQPYYLFKLINRIDCYEPAIKNIIIEICFLIIDGLERVDYSYLTKHLGIRFSNFNTFLIEFNMFLSHYQIDIGTEPSKIDSVNSIKDIDEFFGLETNMEVGLSDMNGLFSLYDDNFSNSSKLIIHYWYDISLDY